MSRRVAILGSTGSIGENALNVVRALPSELCVTGLAADRNYVRLLEQAAEFGVSRVAVADESSARACRAASPRGVEVLAGREGVAEIAADTAADVVLCAIVVMAGLDPVLAAVDEEVDVALATKEVLVAAGELVTSRCRTNGTALLPVDSEHNAIFQCICGAAGGDLVPPLVATVSGNLVRRIMLTASGGPFGLHPEVDLSKVTVEQALKHPRWDMGRKVTIDSATLMNKGLELLEAHWLFGLPNERIDIVIHPESVVHSLVEWNDGSTLAQLSMPDMRYAIQHALTFPRRLDGRLPGLDLVSLRSLHFEAPDPVRFPSLGLAREAMRQGGTLPAVMNAANEAAVEAFLLGAIRFSGIWALVEQIMAEHENIKQPGRDAILAADAASRCRVAELAGINRSTG
jgi:1-deoxy-D-xylulose-5-phosphate reductoisomerase